MARERMKDLRSFHQEVQLLCARRGLPVLELGRVEEDPIQLILPSPSSRGPSLLVVTGFHGDEPGGPLGVLHFLANVEDSLLGQVRISILPLINPTGFRSGTRLNQWGENPNRGYCHRVYFRDTPSREGRIILGHIDRITDLARDGVLSLHEDGRGEKFYLYTSEDLRDPGPFTKALAKTGFQFFPQGKTVWEEYRGCDGSLDDLLFHRGAYRTASTETPSQSPMEIRVAATKKLIETFCSITLRLDQGHSPRVGEVGLRRRFLPRAFLPDQKYTRLLHLHV